MASGCEDNIEGEQTHLWNGHQILFSVRNPNFLESPRFLFDRIFDLECINGSISWLLQLTFRRSETSNNASCVVHLERNDFENAIVDVQFWMKLSFDPFLDIDPISFLLTNVPKDSERTREFYELMPFEYLSQIGERGMLIQIHITVTGCHEEEDVGSDVTECHEEEDVGSNPAMDSDTQQSMLTISKI